MTYVVMSFDPSEVGFNHPLSEELVTAASRYIIDQLNSVVLDHDDTATRSVDLRRTHSPITSSSWLVKFKGNKVLITNQIAGEDAKQFKALTSGNLGKPICASHTTRRIRPGWSNNDRHKSETLGGKKPVPGSSGPEFYGVMKFYDKRNGMWQYRHCVKPISSAIIDDMNRQIRRAVFQGLEMARYELYDRFDKDTEGSNETEDSGMREPFTLEEMSYLHESETKKEKDLEEYRMQKLEDDQVTMDSQISDKKVQESARGILVKAGIEQPPAVDKGAKKVKESFFSKVKRYASPLTDPVMEEIHKVFGVTK